MEPDAQLAPRVLLAVADPLLRRVASSALRSRGYSVSATTEEEAALTLARSFSPDVVMVDLDLPSPEGGNLFDTMRALTDAYIVGIAPPDADTARIRALRAGADDVVAAKQNRHIGQGRHTLTNHVEVNCRVCDRNIAKVTDGHILQTSAVLAKGSQMP